MRFRSFLILSLLLATAACDSGPVTKSYTLEPIETPGGRLCASQCGEAQDYCKQSCSLEFRQCTGKVQSQALLDYDKYTREQFAAHQSIELRPSDFERMSPCTDANKECTDKCDENYRSCYGDCGGKVDVHSSCQSFCF